MHASKGLKWLVVASMALFATAFSQADESSGPIELADVGFVGPESVYHYAQDDVYFVSNTGENAPGTADGFISRVNPDGTVAELKWVDGAAEGVELDSPKGMAVVGERLYVADFGAVRIFDVNSGEYVSSAAIPDSAFLNDVTAFPDGGVLVTDTGVDATFTPVPGAPAVYRVSEDGEVSDHIRDDALGAPNGVTTLPDGRVVVVTFGDPGSVIYVEDGSISETQEIAGHGNFDGVVALDGGDLLVSAWTTSSILRVSPSGEATPVLENISSPADIGFDEDRQRILIPLLQENEVHIVPLPTE